MKRAVLAALLFISIQTPMVRAVPQAETPLSELLNSDFVELQRTRCLGTCPDYTVRVYGDGSVLWKGNDFVQVKGKATSAIYPKLVKVLVQKFIDDGFWRLNGGYSLNATDGSTTTTILHVGNKQKSVSNYFNSGPDKLEVLESEVDAAADTHQWIHGDPRRELMSLGTVGTDGRRPKPGVTPLMRAAFQADAVKVQELLAARSTPDAQDSSGWTALVFAVQGSVPGVFGSRDDVSNANLSGVNTVKLLLDSGADPNIRSYMDQTPLMAAVMSLYFPVERMKLLISAGSDVNVQDKNGQTALMHVIRGTLGRSGTGMYAQQLEICSALLAAGARTDLRDSVGLNVLDTLEQELKRATAGAVRDRVRAMRMQYDQLLTLLRK